MKNSYCLQFSKIFFNDYIIFIYQLFVHFDHVQQNWQQWNRGKQKKNDYQKEAQKGES